MDEEGTVVVAVGQNIPTFMLLAPYVCFARFPLRVECVEILVEAFYGGLPRVDGASNGGNGRC